MNKPDIKLDRTDHRILDALKADGRISYLRLAEQVHLTPRPCQARVRRLEDAGIIQGYTAVVALPEETGGVTLQVQLSLGSQTGRRAQLAFESEVKRCPEVLACWLVSGPFDYALRVRCADMDSWRRLSSAWLVSEDFRIEKIVTSSEMETVKGG